MNKIHLVEKPKLDGVYSIYPLLPNGEPDYDNLIASSKNTVQWEALSTISKMHIKYFTNNNPYTNGYVNAIFTSGNMALWFGTDSSATTKFDSQPNATNGFATCKALKTPTQGPFLTPSCSYTEVNASLRMGKAIFNIVAPPAGTYQEIGIDHKMLVVNAVIYCIGFSRAAFPYTLNGNPIAIVYELYWNNAITNNSALLSADTSITNTNGLTLCSTIKGILSTGNSNFGLLSIEVLAALGTDTSIDNTFEGLKIGTYNSGSTGTTISYKGNGSGVDGLDGATKIQSFQRYTFIFTDVPVGTYTSLYLRPNMQPFTTVFQKLISLTVTDPVNIYTILVDWIIE